MSLQDTRSELDKVLGLFDLAGNVRDGLAASGVQSGEDMVQARRPRSTDNLLGLDLSGMPQSPMAAAAEKYGKGGLFFRNLLSRGGKGIWASALLPDVYGEGAQDRYKTEMEAYKLGLVDQIKRQQMSDAFGGIDMDNLSMEDIATISQFDPNLGKAALEQFQFGRQVEDLGRAREFLNDGIDDENDLWAQEVNLRYGRTGGGQQTSLSNVLNNAQMTSAEFEALPADAQRAVLYQHGTDEDRKAMDRVAGRQTLGEIEAEGAAEKIGEASGDLTAEAIGFIPNAHKIAQDQDFAMQGVDDLITMFNSGEIDTGKWTQMMKDTFGYQTAADGKLGIEATKNLIAQINAATFGALSEREIETLEKTFANGGFTEEANLEILNDVKKKLQLGRDQHGRKTEESLRRIKKYAPDEYEFFMQDDQNWLQYGDGSKVKGIPQLDANGNQLKDEDGNNLPEKTFSDFVGQFGDRYSRDELIAEWDKRATSAKEAEKAREERLKEQKKLAEEAMTRLTADPSLTGQLSPYIARPSQ